MHFSGLVYEKVLYRIFKIDPKNFNNLFSWNNIEAKFWIQFQRYIELWAIYFHLIRG